MAQFRATIQGRRGIASRLGGKQSGIDAKVNGWHLGIRVQCAHVNGEDVFMVFKTGGSTGGRTEELITEIRGN